jgi:acetyl esterase/lipase
VQLVAKSGATRSSALIAPRPLFLPSIIQRERAGGQTATGGITALKITLNILEGSRSGRVRLIVPGGGWRGGSLDYTDNAPRREI